MPVLGIFFVSPFFAYTIIQFIAVTKEMHDTETFKLYSERERFWLYNVSVCLTTIYDNERRWIQYFIYH